MKLPAVLLLVLCSVLPGCFGRLPAVKPPSLDSRAAAESAVVVFDRDDDGALSVDEACAGMTMFWPRYDQDGDGKATIDELETRFNRWSGGDTGQMNLRAQVQFRGRPLLGATVRMTPYEFLGENFLPAEGITDDYGYAFLAIPKDLLPKSQQATFGMQVGLYQVSITHPEVEIPAKYNTETELSVDLSPSEGDTGVRFDLK